MKLKISILIMSLLMIPNLVFADSGSDISIPVAIGIEAFVTIHMSAFVLMPLSKMFSQDNSKKIFWTLFIARVCILLFCDIFISTSVAFLDFVSVFIGAFIVVPICGVITKSHNKVDNITNVSRVSTVTPSTNNIVLKCTKCGNVLTISDTVCSNCGEPFDGNNVQVNISETVQETMLPTDFDPMFKLSESQMVEEFINRELQKAGIDKNSSLIPQEILKKKQITNIIFSILLFVYISLIFFHFPIPTYIVGAVLLFIFYKLTRKYNLIKYLTKQLKARPSEKVSNIVMSVKQTFVEDNTKKTFILTTVVAIILPLVIFVNPRIMYEKVDGGYAVRYYTFGLTNFTTATIPESYKGEKIISLRGNAFSNMYLLKEVSLPNSIKEIRGQAFKNDISLISVNLPEELEYLGGGAFYNCTSITSITIPDTVTEIGGESFYNATSLESIKLSNNITEIKGNTFENCESLKSVVIPDKVTRIGGHAFYGCSSLSEVTLTKNSKLKEIGSSAFRMCTSLKQITLPKGVYINERAFKESPTVKKYFGDLDYGYLINKEDYEYDSLLYFDVNDTEEINKYFKSAKLQSAYISLLAVTKGYNSNIFTLKYKDSTTEKTFDLSADTPYMIVNDNLAIELYSKYVLNYDSSISLNVYYN